MGSFEIAESPPGQRPSGVVCQGEVLKDVIRKLHQAFAQGVFLQTGQIRATRLASQTAPVGFDGAHADIEPGGNFFQAQALGQQAQDLGFALGERLLGTAAALSRAVW